MLRLCIDTAYQYLALALIQNDKLVGSYCKECFKRQSEEVFVAMDQMFKESGFNKEDIDSVCVSIGPGSYTGVRIGLTIAKVISSIKEIELYSISTLKLYANNKENTLVVLNARSNRAYVGAYNNGQCIIEDCVMPLDKIDCKGFDVIGDGELFGLDNKMFDISECFLNNIDNMIKCDNIHHLVPAYLKDNESYMK